MSYQSQCDLTAKDEDPPAFHGAAVSRWFYDYIRVCWRDLVPVACRFRILLINLPAPWLSKWPSAVRLS